MMEHVAFFVVTALFCLAMIALERERVRHRKREQALTDQVIQVTSTKRWEDYAQLRKEVFLADMDSRRAAESKMNHTQEGEPIPPELVHSY